jgi:ABC-2 type transport system ATP-binding protein
MRSAHPGSIGENAVVTVAGSHMGSMLRVEELTHRFGEHVAVDALGLEVRREEIVGLVGRNGAGKTTTMRAIMGILSPDAGRVTWDGHVIDAGHRRRFGYMPEERGLYPQMRVLEQVAYFCELHGFEHGRAMEQARSWLGRLGLAERADERLVALSHGNQQRVQFAVALVHRPDVLVLDEPFSGLDPAAVDMMSDVLRSEATRGAAVLFSSHQLDLVERMCDQVVVIDAGKLLASGSMDELRASSSRVLRVEIEGVPGWVPNIAGVDVLHHDARGVVCRLADGANPQDVLRAAQAAGPIGHFGYEAAGLADIYRDLVRRQ